MLSKNMKRKCQRKKERSRCPMELLWTIAWKERWDWDLTTSLSWNDAVGITDKGPLIFRSLREPLSCWRGVSNAIPIEMLHIITWVSHFGPCGLKWKTTRKREYTRIERRSTGRSNPSEKCRDRKACCPQLIKIDHLLSIIQHTALKIPVHLIR